jgi:hypothetical protein
MLCACSQLAISDSFAGGLCERWAEEHASCSCSRSSFTASPALSIRAGAESFDRLNGTERYEPGQGPPGWFESTGEDTRCAEAIIAREKDPRLRNQQGNPFQPGVASVSIDNGGGASTGGRPGSDSDTAER